MQHNFISDLPARRRRAYFIPHTPKKISGWVELDFTSPGWLKEETLRALGLTLVPSCGACLSNMAIAPDGGVIPCQSWLSSQPLGNILADDWDKIWQSERCAAIRAKSAKMEQLCQLRESNREEGTLC